MAETVSGYLDARAAEAISQHRAHIERQQRIAARAWAALTAPPPAPLPTLGDAQDYYPCMWFFHLVSYVPKPPEPLSIGLIQRRAAAHYGVTKLDLVSARRTADIVRPRQVAMYLAKTLTLRSLPDIGRRFGGRDHTTVLHAVNKITRLLRSEEGLSADVAAIRAAVVT